MKIIGYDSDSCEEFIIKPKTVYFRLGMTCCYCSDVLTIKTCTREHVIAKSRGGKRVEPCCIQCNQEKANMTLYWYIKWLKSNETSEKNNTKIRNAERLLTIYNTLTPPED